MAHLDRRADELFAAASKKPSGGVLDNTVDVLRTFLQAKKTATDREAAKLLSTIEVCVSFAPWGSPWRGNMVPSPPPPPHPHSHPRRCITATPPRGSSGPRWAPR